MIAAIASRLGALVADALQALVAPLRPQPRLQPIPVRARRRRDA